MKPMTSPPKVRLAEAQLRAIQYWLKEITHMDDQYTQKERDTGTEVADLVRSFSQDWLQISHAQQCAAERFPIYCAAFPTRCETLLEACCRRARQDPVVSKRTQGL